MLHKSLFFCFNAGVVVIITVVVVGIGVDGDVGSVSNVRMVARGSGRKARQCRATRPGFVTVVNAVVTFVAVDVVVVGVVIVVVVGDGVGLVPNGPRGLYRQETKQCGTTRSFS